MVEVDTKPLASQIPPELMHPERKAAVIEWLRGTHLPSRFKRAHLQAWGQMMLVDLTGDDYVLVVTPLARSY